MTTQQVDHRAEALRLLADAGEESGKLEGGDRDYVKQLRAEALVHSNLAIAQGQERVAEALRPRGVENGDLTRHILDALEQPADDPSDSEATYMQSRIDAAIKGWFGV